MKNLRDWLSWRDAGIGSSDAPVIMEASPWCSPTELWARKTGRLAPQEQTFPMREGLRLEPIARAAYEKLTGIAMPPTRSENESLPFIRATFDGVNHDARKVLEIKCPGEEDHLTAKRGEIPKKYLWQCVHLLFVSGFEHLDYYSFKNGEGVLVPFQRDRRLEHTLLIKELEFWRYIEDDIEPPKKPVTKLDGIFPIRRKR